MNVPSLPQLVPILQLAVGPVILISGVGLLQRSLTNRLGRLIDRARLFSRDRAAAGTGDTARIDAQRTISGRRASILRRSIMLGALAVQLVSVLILVRFVSALLRLEAGLLVIALFGCALLTLIGSNGYFIREMNLSLDAVHPEICRDGVLPLALRRVPDRLRRNPSPQRRPVCYACQRSGHQACN